MNAVGMPRSPAGTITALGGGGGELTSCHFRLLPEWPASQVCQSVGPLGASWTGSGQDQVCGHWSPRQESLGSQDSVLFVLG